VEALQEALAGSCDLVAVLDTDAYVRTPAPLEAIAAHYRLSAEARPFLFGEEVTSFVDGAHPKIDTTCNNDLEQCDLD